MRSSISFSQTIKGAMILSISWIKCARCSSSIDWIPVHALSTMSRMEADGSLVELVPTTSVVAPTSKVAGSCSVSLLSAATLWIFCKWPLLLLKVILLRGSICGYLHSVKATFTLSLTSRLEIINCVWTNFEIEANYVSLIHFYLPI